MFILWCRGLIQRECPIRCQMIFSRHPGVVHYTGTPLTHQILRLIIH